MITVLNDINDFTKIVTANHNVLVDFNATWCGPCRIMGRIIEEIKDDYYVRKAIREYDRRFIRHEEKDGEQEESA